jgi:DNA-directed RNA polymerase subunit RPC12/RpoP
MKCSLCGHEFHENDVRAGCSYCRIVKKCDLIRCPNCNFEMAPEPKWIKKLKKYLLRVNSKHATRNT